MTEQELQQFEWEVKAKLQMKWGVDCYIAQDIIDMVRSICSTKGAALYHISDYINSHF